MGSYPEPVGRLLTPGEPKIDQWPDYRAMGLGPEHVPDLIRPATESARYVDEKEGPEIFGPVHAWYALGQLGTAEAVPPLLNLLDRLEEIGDNWAFQDLPKVFALIGPPALPAMKAFLADNSAYLYALVAAVEGMVQLAQAHLEARGEVVSAPAAVQDPPDPYVLATVPETVEGGASPGNFRVYMESASGQPVTVHYSVSGTATAGVKYQTLPGTVTIPAGATYADIPVTPLNDTLVEGSETITITLQPDPSYILSQSTSATAVIFDNDGSGPPVLTGLGSQSNAEGDTISLPIHVMGGTAPMSFGAVGLPSGLTIDSGSGIISGPLDYTDAQTQGGQYSVTVTVYDSNGASGSTSFNWTVTNTDTPPTLDAPGNQTSWEGDAVALQLSASDADGDPLTYSATGLPNGLTINSSTGLISGVLAAPDGASSPYSVTVSAFDGTTNVSQSFTWTVARVQVDPVADQSSLIGDSVSLPVNAWGLSGQTVSYSATGLPPGLSINSSTGLISGTIDPTAGGAYSVSVAASDSQGNSGSTGFTWNVTYLNQTPTLANPGAQFDRPGDVVSLPVNGYDVDGDTVTYSATGLPAGLGIDAASGVISGTVAANAGSGTPYGVTVTASDGTLNASQTFNWFVTSAPVTLTSPGDQINTEGDAVSLQLAASGSGLTYRASGLPAGLTLNASTGLISGTVSSGDAATGPYTVTVSATDSQGNGSAQTYPKRIGYNVYTTRVGKENNGTMAGTIVHPNSERKKAEIE